MTREEAKERLQKIRHEYTFNSNKEATQNLKAIDMAIEALSADRPTHDCTNLVQWLLEEAMDEESWRENADANGEIICRKLKKLGVLDTKDGYYIRTTTITVHRAERQWRTNNDNRHWNRSR